QAHPDLQPGLDTLRNWNYVADTESTGMTFFHVYWATLKSMLPATLSEGALLDAIAAGDAEAQTLSLKAAEQAARLMRSEFGSLSVPWGEAHRFVRGKQSTPAAGTGSGDAIFIASDADFSEKVWRVNYGYAYAMVVKLGETVDTASVVPFGASEDPDSPHYADQMDLIRERRMKVVRFDPEDVRRNAKLAYGCSVRFSPTGLPASGIVRSGSPVSVGSAMYTQPPAQLPLGLATFTVYTRVMVEPASAPVTVDLSVYIPPELCPEEHLSSLVAFAYDDTTGWSRLDAQTIDPATRILSFRDRRARTYAILAPAEYRAAQESDMRSRVALTIPDSAIRERVPKLSSLKSPDAPPPLVPGAPGAREALQRRAQNQQTAQSPQDEGGPGQTPVAEAPATPQEVATQTSPQTEATPSQTPEAAPTPSTTDGPLPPPVQMPAAPEFAPSDGSSRVRQGAIAWGSALQLRPPGVEGIIKVSADKPVGARLSVSPDPPRPLPENLAAFTEFVQVECSAKDTQVDIEISLRPGKGTCSEANLERLELYAFDEARGWTKLPEQSFDPKLRGFNAKDSRPQWYVLLGSPAWLLKP
ncbi:MAG: penicillin acylase family protein, partial [Candidatus Hydrogenedentes bacterium]|nr:penicillin acylase family protein [Candidatus Hydrogenedentota bacterium]